MTKLTRNLPLLRSGLFALLMAMLGLLSLSNNAQAQQSSLLVYGEYYFDTDPGYGLGTPLIFAPDSVVDVNLNISLSGLIPGSHNLYVRFQDDSGRWTHDNVFPVIVSPVAPVTGNPPPITGLEYAFDNDPGLGNGNFLPNTGGGSVFQATNTIPVDTLSSGFHTVFFRALDSIGNWSHTYTSTFFLFDTTSTQSPLLTEVEYFFNNDPGFGSGTVVSIPPDSINYFLDTVSVRGLGTGYHSLYYRVKDNNGNWSLTNVSNFFVTQDSTKLPLIVRGEYYFDSDPGYGFGAPIPGFIPDSVIDVSFQIPINSLSPGVHRLYTRVQDDAGNWSHNYVGPFMRMPSNVPSIKQPLTAMEYYFDTDPGEGNGVDIPVATPDSILSLLFAPALDTLAVGFHTLFIRSKDTTGTWSHTYRSTFYLYDSLVGSSPLIVGGEYFWDNDPGFGNANPISFNPDSLVQVADTISIAGLTAGVHRLYIRTIDTLGNWSLVYTQTVFVQDDNGGADPTIVAAEYFIDTDPGEGNGTPVAVDTSLNVVDTNFFVPMTGLSIGAHKLYVRVLDSRGSWSLNYVRDIIVIPDGTSSSSPNIIATEYFFNNDPGFGNAYPIANFSPDSIVNIVSTLPVDTLPVGFHTIYIRTLDTNGIWSLTYSSSFYLFDSAVNTSPLLVGGEYFWDTDPGFGNGTSITFNPDSVVQVADTISIAGLSTGIHRLYIRAIDSLGNWSLVYSAPVFIIDDNGGLDPDIIAAEFFVDTDPGFGNGTPIAVDSNNVIDTSFTVPTAGLSIGAHKLYVRTLDTRGNWSLAYVRDIIIIPDGTSSTSPNIVAAEYFFNNDPGFGNAYPITNFSPDSIVNIVSTLPVDTLPVGFHTIYIRTLDTNGIWSLTYSATFYLYDSAVSSSPLLVGGEYFWDTDPGFGNGTSITFNPDSVVQVADTISIAGLSTGIHRLYIRTIDSLGNWSLVYSAPVFIIDDNGGVDPDIIAAEFFVDTDPGFGNGTPIAVDSNNVIDTNFIVPTAGLSIGAHKLYVRTLDTRGNWSLTYVRDIIIIPDGTSSTSPNIVAAEYFFNNDPGFGNAYPIANFSPDSIVNIVSTLPVDTLPVGFHTIYIRTLDTNGIWSLTYSSSFYLFDSAVNTSPLLVGGEYFWDTDPGFGNGTSITFNPDSVVQVADTISIAGLSTGIHRLYIRVIDSLGNWSLVYSAPVFIIDDNGGVDPDIIAAEFFVDTDPGFGNGTPIAVDTNNIIDTNFVVPTAGLSIGAHKLYVRTLDTRGNWSLAYVRDIIIIPDGTSSTSPNIVAAEYFFNNDPGLGNGYVIDTFNPDSIVNYVATLPVDTLPVGFHTIYIRTLDTNGIWSLTYSSTFYLYDSAVSSSPLLVGGEYFWDTDPGFGNGTSITFNPDSVVQVADTISIAGLSTGIHRLYIRVIDSLGNWSLVYSAPVFIIDDNGGVDPDIIAAEYFVDTDPGFGNGIPVPVDTNNVIDTNFTVNTAALSIGAHKLYVRTLDDRGNWSLAYVRDIIIVPDGASSQSPAIVAAEYFFDNDPGFGNGYVIDTFNPDSIINLVATIPVDTLPTGFHTIYIRTLDTNGIWSLTYSSTFYLFDTTNSASPILAGGEFFWDNDPGFGNGTPIAFNPDSVVQVADTISVAGLSTGMHRLYIRTYDTLGNWSLVYTAVVFIIDNDTVDPNIVSAEYFVDVDPGFGNGTPIAVDTNNVIDTNFTVNTAGLSIGAHKLYVRTLDDQGNWSLAYVRDIIIVPDGASSQSPAIVAAEYFFNNDPGFGNGYVIDTFNPDSIVNYAATLPVDTLPTGFHTIYIRTLDTNGLWSLTYSATFYLYDSAVSTSPLLVGGEYFWDTDPGFGNGTPVTFNPDSVVQVADTISIAGLSTGMHRLYIRVIDSLGNWSLVYSAPVFIIDNDTVDPNIVSAEYFVDVDPGFGNGTPIAVDTNNVIDTNFTVNTAGLSIGAHKLYVRTLDDQGNWSLAYVRDIIIVPDGASSQSPLIVAAEYFFNNDPGFGNAYPISNFSSDSIVNIVSTLPVDTLPVGFHTVYIRTLDTNGIWSLTYSSSFYLFDSAVNTSPLLVGGEYFWDTDPGFGNGNPINFNPDSVVQVADTISIAGLSTGIHRLYIRTIDSLGNWSLVYTAPVFIIDDNGGVDPDIIAAEFFVDTDPGFGNGTPIAVDTNNVIDTNFVVPTAGLSIGAHKLYVRTLDTRGNWSLAYVRDIIIIPDGTSSSSPLIVAAEYFFNNDPGFGSGYPISNFSPDSIVNIVSTLPVDTLPVGFHTVYIRTLDTNGIWSLTYSTTFYLYDSAVSTSPLLVGGEYFWDTDPGFGNGTPITFNPDSVVQVADTISLAGLSTGIHRLYIRTIDSLGNWSLVYTAPVFIIDDNGGVDPDIVAAEFFVDTDPGFGNGTPIAVDTNNVIDTSFVVPTAGLSIGAHKLYVRTLDTRGNWSLAYVRDIIIVPDGASSTSPLIVAAEYFFNNDPGFGSGYPISNFSPDSIVNIVSTLPVDTLPVGFHTVYIRTLDTNGIWSLTYSTTFYLYDSAVSTSPLLVGGEYFWDTDPGFGNGTPITFNPDSVVQVADTISLAGLSTGIHRLYIRTIDSLGNWSLVYSAPVFIIDDNGGVDPDIVAAEFFVDTDPGFGNGTPIAVDTNNVIDTNFVVPTAGLSIGAHKLYVRTLDTRGNWSLAYVRDIIIVPDGASSTSPLIVAAEYFFNNDPGLGSGYPISNFSPDSIVNIVSTLPVDTLPVGFHTVYIRTLDTNGIWSLTYSSSFYLFDSAVNTSPLLVGGEYFWDTDPGFGNGNPINFNPDSVVQVADSISIAGLSTGIHRLYIRTIDSLGNWSLVYTAPVFIIDDNGGVDPDIVAAEFFVDIDPGFGNGTPIPVDTNNVIDTNFVVPTAGLSIGAHKLYVRTLDTRGNWSLAYVRDIIIIPDGSTSTSPLIVAAEYFFDSDPGHGNAYPIAGFNPDSIIQIVSTLPVDTLPTGFHTIYIRTLDTNGIWSLTYNSTFYLYDSAVSSSPLLVGGEYFWDTDPGFGNASPITFNPDSLVEVADTISLAGLSTGIHRLYIRVIDSLGNWSLVYSAPVFIIDDNGGVDPLIVAAEYFVDIDPGEGNGTAIPVSTPDSVVDLNFNAALTGLSPGIHRIYFRTLDDNGKWSLDLIKPIVVLPEIPANNRPDLVAGEYFFDIDPSFGSATAFNFANDSIIDITELVRDTSLSNGLHTLYIRTKDTFGQWGMTHRWNVFISDDQPQPQVAVNAVEVFWDTDPGFGNGTIVSVSNPGTLVHDTVYLPLCNLTNGVHRLYVRPIDASGIYGLADFTDVAIYDSGTGGINLVVASNSPVCEGDSIQLTVDSVGNATYKWFGPTGLNVGTDRISYLTNASVVDSGDYAIEVDQNGCKYYDTVEVDVQPQLQLANWITDTSICVPDTITLNATVSNYPVALYSWNTGDTTASISTFSRDTFTVTVTDTGNVCIITDTVRVDWNITFPRVWEGNIDSDWMKDRNWSCGGTPDSTTDVMIPDVTLTTGNEPIVNPGVDAKVRTIEMEPGSGIILRGYLWVNEP